MRRTSRAVLATGLFFFSLSAWAQSNPCDLNGDGRVDATDVQAAINMSLGVSSCSANIAGLNVCNVIVVQRVINASMGASCTTSTGLHVVALNWTASTSTGITGYKLYRGTASGGPYTLIQTLGNVTSAIDNTVLSGQTYYYVITAVSSTGAESPFSSPTQATISVP